MPPAEGSAAGRYRVAEWSFRSTVEYANPWREIEVAFVFTTPAGRELRVPAFWAGGRRWRARYSSGEPGEHRFRTECSDSGNAGLHGRIGAVRVVEVAGENRVDLHGRTGSVRVVEAASENPLFRHGPVRLDPSRTHLEHADGTPFFWLADTWWMGLAERLRWPEDVRRLTGDRVAKGFTVVQIVAGLYPDMEPFDERARNEAGFPWDRGFSHINPAYFDAADRRIMHLVESGVVPCIVGAWGFFVDVAGPAAMREHWRYLVARWGALPVVWCLAGEAGMPFYTSEEGAAYMRLGLQERLRYRNPDRIRAWSDVARSVRSLDPFGRPFTVHPTRSGRAQVDDPSLLDFEMLQTGHLGFTTLADTVDMIESTRAAEPRLPLLVAEANYEGEYGSSLEDVQRYLFWMSMLSGAMGHTYGAHGIWQVNRPDRPYGPSPHGLTYGDRSWQEASELPGARQVGLAARFLARLPWWRFEPHPEWVEPHQGPDDRMGVYAAGIEGQLAVLFVPMHALWKLANGVATLGCLHPGEPYEVTYFDPISGAERLVAEPLVAGAGGRATLPAPAEVRDWVLLVRRRDAEPG